MVTFGQKSSRPTRENHASQKAVQKQYPVAPGGKFD